MKNEKNIYILIQFSGEPWCEKIYQYLEKVNSKIINLFFNYIKTLDYFSFSSIEKENILLFDTKKQII